MTDEAVDALEQERAALAARIEAIDIALGVLRGTPMGTLTTLPSLGRRVAVGDDKVAAVRQYVTKHKRVRQADVVRDLKMNSGTVSQAFAALEQLGEVERGPKEDRSRIWFAPNHS